MPLITHSAGIVGAQALAKIRIRCFPALFRSYGRPPDIVKVKRTTALAMNLSFGPREPANIRKARAGRLEPPTR